jgi:gamma-glutamyltranspeptidase/glutathione hydrolase
VLEPCSTGIGGDAFALIWWAEEGKLFGLNASGPASMALSAGWLREQGYEEMPSWGPLSVTVPGSLRGWQLALERFGSMGLDSLLSPSIHYARTGFPVSEVIAGQWGTAVDLMRGHPDSRRVWLPGGRAPRPAEIFRNPEFASTLETLAEEGYDAFYRGEIGRQIVACVQEAGGVLADEDLAGYRAEWVEPISAAYRDGFTFHEIPPNGQGLAALLALKLVGGFDQKAMGYASAERWHLMIEAMKVAFADARAYIADPRQAGVPVAGLLSESYLERRLSILSRSESSLYGPGRPPSGGDTVYLAVVDGAGNMVSWIQSLYDGFGSGLTAGTTGIQLHNRGANFVLEPGHPNEVAPGKRPYHTIIPGFISRDGRPWAAFGVMGGFMQPQGHLQVGANLVDFEMSPQAALDAPRFRWLDGKRVALEQAVPEAIKRELAGRGHEVLIGDSAGRVSFGGGQIIIRDPEGGVLIGGSDPRKDGAAVGY